MVFHTFVDGMVEHYPAIRGLAYRGLQEEGHASLPDVRLPWMPWMCVCEYVRVYVRVCVAC